MHASILARTQAGSAARPGLIFCGLRGDGGSEHAERHCSRGACWGGWSKQRSTAVVVLAGWRAEHAEKHCECACWGRSEHAESTAIVLAGGRSEHAEKHCICACWEVGACREAC
eukprot:2319583-Lingulodinium_polyedra.AAC.2